MPTFTRLFALLALSSVLALTGCDGFFFKENTSGTGTGTGGTASSFVFVANSAANTVTGLGISTTGALTGLTGSPIAFTVSPVTLTVSRDNKYLWVGSLTSIFGFSISSTGTLTALNSGNPLQNARCVDMQTTPDGKWLMVLDGSGSSIDLFAINTDGTLAAASGASFAASGTTVPRALAISPGGTIVVASLGTAGEQLFFFDTMTGAFSGGSQKLPPDASTGDNGIAFDPSGTRLYVAQSGNVPGLVVYTVNSDGELFPATGSPYATGAAPFAVTVDKAGKNVYVANRNDNNITAYGIGTTGALTQITGSPFASGMAVQSLGVDKTGTWLLAAAFSGTPDLTLYGFSSTVAGQLTTVTSSPTGANANALALSY